MLPSHPHVPASRLLHLVVCRLRGRSFSNSQKRGSSPKRRESGVGRFRDRDDLEGEVEWAGRAQGSGGGGRGGATYAQYDDEIASASAIASAAPASGGRGGRVSVSASAGKAVATARLGGVRQHAQPQEEELGNNPKQSTLSGMRTLAASQHGTGRDTMVPRTSTGTLVQEHETESKRERDDRHDDLDDLWTVAQYLQRRPSAHILRVPRPIAGKPREWFYPGDLYESLCQANDFVSSGAPTRQFYNLPIHRVQHVTHSDSARSIDNGKGSHYVFKGNYLLSLVCVYLCEPVCTACAVA